MDGFDVDAMDDQMAKLEEAKKDYDLACSKASSGDSRKDSDKSSEPALVSVDDRLMANTASAGKPLASAPDAGVASIAVAQVGDALVDQISAHCYHVVNQVCILAFVLADSKKHDEYTEYSKDEQTSVLPLI